MAACQWTEVCVRPSVGCILGSLPLESKSHLAGLWNWHRKERINRVFNGIQSVMLGFSHFPWQGCPTCLPPMGRMRLRSAMNAAQHKIVNLLETLWDSFVLTCHNYLMCSPRQLFFFQCGPEMLKAGHQKFLYISYSRSHQSSDSV